MDLDSEKRALNRPSTHFTKRRSEYLLALREAFGRSSKVTLSRISEDYIRRCYEHLPSWFNFLGQQLWRRSLASSDMQMYLNWELRSLYNITSSILLWFTYFWTNWLSQLTSFLRYYYNSEDKWLNTTMDLRGEESEERGVKLWNDYLWKHFINAIKD